MLYRENCSHHMACAACHLETLDIADDMRAIRLPEIALTIKDRCGRGCSVHLSMRISRSMGRKVWPRFVTGCRLFPVIFRKGDLDTFLKFSMETRLTVRAAALPRPGLSQRSCVPLWRT